MTTETHDGNDEINVDTANKQVRSVRNLSKMIIRERILENFDTLWK
jgi:hypothetical protein